MTVWILFSFRLYARAVFSLNVNKNLWRAFDNNLSLDYRTFIKITWMHFSHKYLLNDTLFARIGLIYLRRERWIGWDTFLSETICARSLFSKCKQKLRPNGYNFALEGETWKIYPPLNSAFFCLQNDSKFEFLEIFKKF